MLHSGDGGEAESAVSLGYEGPDLPAEHQPAEHLHAETPAF